MSNSAFPRGWHVTSGALGTDVIFDNTTFLSGNASVYFPSTASASATVVSDWVPIDDVNYGGTPSATEDVACKTFYVRAHVYASSVAANKDIKFDFETADAARTTITTQAVYNDVLPSANTWHPIGTQMSYSATGRWMRLSLTRPTDYDFDLYLDSVEFRRAPPFFRGTSTGATFNSANWTVPTYVSGGPANTGVNRCSEASGIVTMTQPGVYQAVGGFDITDAVADGDVVGCRIGVQTSSGVAWQYWYQTLFASAAYTPGKSVGATVSAQWPIASDYRAGVNTYTRGKATFELFQYAGATLDYDNAYFHIIRIAE